ncbi:hypothetical protein ACFPA8_16415 [Streptomyces ovatisporus]|uniref:Uncharacterized protein n=1 Tax=Streptomyces ovatisporus TaxID=1128682 RepID=A0ABV9A729_9ACTN
MNEREYVLPRLCESSADGPDVAAPGAGRPPAPPEPDPSPWPWPEDPEPEDPDGAGD